MNKSKDNIALEKDANTQQSEMKDDYDPYLETFISVETKPKPEMLPIITQPITKSTLNKPVAQKYDYGYQIILTNPNEDGLMETFINETIAEDKPRSDPSDWFNFGLDEDKWRKILNHNILMHYEKQLILESQNKSEQQQQQIQPPLPTYNNQVSQSNQMQMHKQNMYMNQFQQMQLQMRNTFPNQIQNYFNNPLYQQRQIFPINSQVPTTGPTEDK